MIKLYVRVNFNLILSFWDRNIFNKKSLENFSIMKNELKKNENNMKKNVN